MDPETTESQHIQPYPITQPTTAFLPTNSTPLIGRHYQAFEILSKMVNDV